jgi:chromosome segregation ATPase
MNDPTPPESKAEPLTTHHLGLLVEMFETHKNLMLEGFDALRESIERKTNEQFEQIKMRLDVIELAVRKNSEAIQKNTEAIEQNTRDIERLRRQLVAVRRRTRRIENTLDHMQRQQEAARLELRVSALEARLGITPKR